MIQNSIPNSHNNSQSFSHKYRSSGSKNHKSQATTADLLDLDTLAMDNTGRYPKQANIHSLTSKRSSISLKKKQSLQRLRINAKTSVVKNPSPTMMTNTSYNYIGDAENMRYLQHSRSPVSDLSPIHYRNDSYGSSRSYIHQHQQSHSQSPVYSPNTHHSQKFQMPVPPTIAMGINMGKQAKSQRTRSAIDYQHQTPIPRTRNRTISAGSFPVKAMVPPSTSMMSIQSAISSAGTSDTGSTSGTNCSSIPETEHLKSQMHFINGIFEEEPIGLVSDADTGMNKVSPQQRTETPLYPNIEGTKTNLINEDGFLTENSSSFTSYPGDSTKSNLYISNLIKKLLKMQEIKLDNQVDIDEYSSTVLPENIPLPSFKLYLNEYNNLREINLKAEEKLKKLQTNLLNYSEEKINDLSEEIIDQDNIIKNQKDVILNLKQITSNYEEIIKQFEQNQKENELIISNFKKELNDTKEITRRNIEDNVEEKTYRIEELETELTESIQTINDMESSINDYEQRIHNLNYENAKLTEELHEKTYQNEIWLDVIKEFEDEQSKNNNNNNKDDESNEKIESLKMSLKLSQNQLTITEKQLSNKISKLQKKLSLEKKVKSSLDKRNQNRQIQLSKLISTPKSSVDSTNLTPISILSSPTYSKISAGYSSSRTNTLTSESINRFQNQPYQYKSFFKGNSNSPPNLFHSSHKSFNSNSTFTSTSSNSFSDNYHMQGDDSYSMSDNDTGSVRSSDSSHSSDSNTYDLSSSFKLISNVNSYDNIDKLESLIELSNVRKVGDIGINFINVSREVNVNNDNIQSQ